MESSNGLATCTPLLPVQAASLPGRDGLRLAQMCKCDMYTTELQKSLLRYQANKVNRNNYNHYAERPDYYIKGFRRQPDQTLADGFALEKAPDE